MSGVPYSVEGRALALHPLPLDLILHAALLAQLDRGLLRHERPAAAGERDLWCSRGQARPDRSASIRRRRRGCESSHCSPQPSWRVPSPHSIESPVQTPATQTSSSVHALAVAAGGAVVLERVARDNRRRCPCRSPRGRSRRRRDGRRWSAGSKPSAGQLALAPVQLSATSHTPAVPRHSTVLGSNASAGQSSATPSQISSVSQTSATARHDVVLFTSGGQKMPAPSQVSARSQTPSAGRHTVVMRLERIGRTIVR